MRSESGSDRVNGSLSRRRWFEKSLQGTGGGIEGERTGCTRLTGPDSLQRTSRAGSAVSNPRVENGVQEIRNERHHHDCHGGDGDDRLNDDDVAVPDGLQELLAHPGKPEDRLDEDCPSDEGRE